MATKETVRLTLIFLVGIQLVSVVLADYRSESRNDFINWLRSHSNNENALMEYGRANDVTTNREIQTRRALISDLIPILIKELEQYRYALMEQDNRSKRPVFSTVSKRFYGKRNFAWQPMGGPLPVETRLVAFGSKLGPGGGEGGSSNKAMRYGR